MRVAVFLATPMFLAMHVAMYLALLLQKAHNAPGSNILSFLVLILIHLQKRSSTLGF